MSVTPDEAKALAQMIKLACDWGWPLSGTVLYRWQAFVVDLHPTIPLGKLLPHVTLLTNPSGRYEGWQVNVTADELEELVKTWDAKRRLTGRDLWKEEGD